jgi:hypothetical protein
VTSKANQTFFTPAFDVELVCPTFTINSTITKPLSYKFQVNETAGEIRFSNFTCSEKGCCVLTDYRLLNSPDRQEGQEINPMIATRPAYDPAAYNR